MTMVDENDPYKGLKTKKSPLFDKIFWWGIFGLILILVLVFYVREDYVNAQFGIMTLMFLAVSDMMRSMRRELVALRAQLESQRVTITNTWNAVPQQTMDLITGQRTKRDPKG